MYIGDKLWNALIGGGARIPCPFKAKLEEVDAEEIMESFCRNICLGLLVP